MKALKLLFLFVLVASPALAQSGLISGVVVVAQDDGTVTADVPIIVDGEGVGETGDDGKFTIPEDTFDDDESVEIFIGGGDDPVIYIDPEGENSCEEENEKNANDEDDDCVSIGIFKWRPGILIVDYGDDPSSDYTPGDGDEGQTGGGDYGDDDDSPYGVDIAIGYVGDWKSVTFAIRGYWERPVEQLPVDLEVGFSYWKPSEFQSVFMPMIELSCRYALTELASAYGAGGIRFIRQKYDAFGFSSTNTETAAALRAGAQYDVGPVKVFGEVETMFAYETTIFGGRVGARYGF
jgi:hypothetical protein